MLEIMRTADFDFALPPGLVAQQPAEPRDASRLMVLRRGAGTIEHHHFRDLPGLLEAGDLLVVNDTRVMAARVFGTRPGTGGRVEALLVRPLSDLRWETLFRPARQATPGRRFVFGIQGESVGATVVERREGVVVLEFDEAFDPATAGTVPLPPYIKEYRGDPDRYQTVYSRDARSAAAPTAGLHFTPALIETLAARGIEHTAVTLEVGPGTFKPVTVEDPREHHLHAEHVTVPADAAAAIMQAKREGRRVVAVGTTVVRTLEHAWRETGSVSAYDGWTTLRILPGDEFHVVDALITNFHLPRSTLLMLVCALAGQAFVLEAYADAVARGYRFYSFGDAMLVLP
jgi:S-adenosylmethionine:tRNA ribosyltransferase-isomerase